MARIRFSPVLPARPALTLGDGIILLGIAALLYAGVRLAFSAPHVVAGPEISLAPQALPWYGFLSVGRMATAYFLSLLFSVTYGYLTARNRTARKVLMPLLDVLQSVPILSFLPVVLLSFSAVLPQSVAAELAAIVLIFTSQVWNMTFSFYQSMTMVPYELREAAAVFRFNPWLRFKALEFPFAALGLIWNSMMSWAGGWFFLMAAEIFRVGDRDFRLPGLGSYLQTAADAGDIAAILRGLAMLVLIIVLLDQLVWRPLLAWAEKFKLEMIEGDEPQQSWFFDLLARSWLVRDLIAPRWGGLSERLDRWVQDRFGARIDSPEDGPANSRAPHWATLVLAGGAMAAVAYGSYRAAILLASLAGAQWLELGVGLLATLARVALALAMALLWTVPVGVLIGTQRRLAAVLQPVVQLVASIPATALFPVLLLSFLHSPGGLNTAAVLLMLLGTQWYLLFNVIAGATAMPRDLRDTTRLLHLSAWQRWRTLILPALYPYIITGAITAGGGAWNASIVAEQVRFGGHTYATTGVGALISHATAVGDYPMLLASTLGLVVLVVLLNRLFWVPLYRLAEERYRMD